MNKNQSILECDVISRKGTTIKAGEQVTIAFDLKTKSGHPYYTGFSMRTSDGRKINSKNFVKAGLIPPSMEELEEMHNDGVCDSVFGESVEPDGVDCHGAPSWLLALGLI